MTNLLQFTINVRKIPPSISVHFATRVRRSRVVRLSWSLRSFIRAAASKMRASNSSRVATFLLYTSLFIQPHKPKSKLQGRTVRARFKQLYLGNSSELDIYAYDFFFSQWPVQSPPKIWTFPSESPCVFHMILNPTNSDYFPQQY